jgi:TolB-like protein/Tfp pilus assembly protein PilF
MEPGRWGRITDIYHATIARPPEERPSFLGEECHGDESLRKQVEAMVKSHERSGNFIETPAFAVAPELLIGEPTGDLIGQLIGHYRIESLLGVGGMGEVYLARDERLGRKVALKLLPAHLTEDETQLNRFKTEARTASALNHPNILTVHEIGAEGNRHFIATEFIEGITLRALLRRGRMNPHSTLEIAVQVASALAAAHETGVVHRDIKPENIMLRPDGYAKVLDFGIAKLTEPELAAADHHAGTTTLLQQTRPGLVIGTAQYMSPEQTRGQAADARSDIWSLGVVLYEMVGGNPPFSGATPSDCIASILKTEPPPLSCALPDVPIKLQSIVHKALRKNRDERYQTTREMLADLRDLKAELERESSLPQIKGRAESIVSKIKRHKRGALAILSVATVAAATIAYHFYFATPMPPINGKSIAVLPFVDLSQARDQEYLCDGIQEEILNRLSKIADLKVISRTSTQRYKSAREKLPAMARQLGAAHILEGTVQRAEDQVRIHVQLIDARNDSYLWAEKYDRKLTDVFGVESEIAKAIADSLGAKLSGLEQRAIATRPTENAAAHQLYLQGTYFSNKRTGADLQTATEYFQAAIRKDPKYAAAYAGLADAFTLLSLWGGDPADTMPQAKAAARKAIELDETLPEAHNSLGLVLALHDFDFAQSQKEFERAIELNPNYATAHHQFGNVNLSMIGEFDRAIAEGNRAVELDPLSLIINTDLGQDFMLARRYDEAIEHLRKTLAMDPRFYYARWTLGECLQMKGQLTEAMSEYQKAAEITDDPVVMALLAQGYAKMGQRDKALDLLGQLEQLAKHRHVGPFTFALVQLALDETEKTIDDLERAYRERDPNIVGIKVEPLLDPLRGHPRFERLLAKVVGNAENKSPTQPIESKSIAVLPFEDLSENKEHAFFADGVQDDVLTKLAKVADLKVISRTSVMQYRGKQNLREIGRVLGVSHVLEGTVRRSEGKVHINAQLVDARTDTHVWAEEYDRNLNEVFAIEIEMAQSIANQLRARVSTREQTAMQERPTEDLVAYDLYTRGKNLVLTASGRSTGRTDLLLAVDQLNQAVAHDPSFLQAYCQLASAHDHLYSLGFDRTSARLELANAAIQTASRLRPDAGEAHLARAENLYRGYLDYIGALAELEVARQSLPNDARVLQLMGFILRRQGRWEEATQKLQRTIELDPRNTYTLQQMAWHYLFVRRYAEVKPLLARVLAIEPNRTDTEVFLASVDFHWKADIGPFHQMVDSIRASNPSALPSIADAWLTCALAERDPGAAANAMAAVGDDAFGDDAVHFSRTFVEGLVARIMKDEGKARSAFTAARSEQEKIVRAQSNYGPPLCVLGLVDAALGRKEEALHEGRRAIELLPVEKDAIRGVAMIKYSAMIAAWAGDNDLACEQLASALRYPSSPSYGDLKLLPFWDPLRGDPRFERIVASLAPK